MISVGVDVGKRGFQACLKDDGGSIPEELSLPNDGLGARRLLEALDGREAKAVMEATGNHWVRLYEALEARGVRALLANHVKTRLIAEARIETDRLDARILADLLRGNLVAESYVPSRKRRDWRSLVRRRASLVRMGVDVKNRVQALLDRYELKPGFSDLFGKAGMRWLEGLRLSPVDQLILETDLRLLRSLNEQVYAVTRAVASLALSEAPVRLVMTMPGIDYYSAMLYVAALGDRDMRLMMQLRKENGLWKIVQSRGDRLPTLTPMRGFIPGTVELTPKLQDVVRVKHCFWLEADGVLWKWYRVGTLEMKLYALAWNGKHVTLKARHSILVGGVAPLSQGNL